jgi:hypothetical protein
MAFAPVGTIGVSPTDREVLVGDFSLEEGDDTLFLRVTQTSPLEHWSYSFGLLTWRSTGGQELGTVKVFGSKYGENYRLGIGRAPLVRTGSIYFRPRSYNRNWIAIDEPPIWVLEIEAESGKTAGSGSGQRVGLVVNSFVDTSDNGLSLVRVNFP